MTKQTMTPVIVSSKAKGFQKFTGGQYIMIDIMGQYGFDKLNFESRLATFEKYKDDLHAYIDTADAPALYLKGIFAYEAALRGEAIGHVIGFDACASGPQIMSCIVGCAKGAHSTGLVDPTLRQDLYGITMDATKEAMEAEGNQLDTTRWARKEIKSANMPWFYSSDAQPKKIFGIDTPEYYAFIDGMFAVTPGAANLRNDLLNCWQAGSKSHSWTLPDNHFAYVPVLNEKTVQVEVDELNHAQFSHIIRINEGTKTGRSIGANVVHSVDGIVVREMNRRCNYHVLEVSEAMKVVSAELSKRGEVIPMTKPTTEFKNFLPTNLLLTITEEEAAALSSAELLRRYFRLVDMLESKSFEILCIHDEFKCHPNNMNQLRFHYKEILAELAESNILEDILNEIVGGGMVLQKESEGLAATIRNSNYALS